MLKNKLTKAIGRSSSSSISSYLLIIVIYQIANDIIQALVNIIVNSNLALNETALIAIAVLPAYLLMTTCGFAIGTLTAKRAVIYASVVTALAVMIDINFISQIATGNYTHALLMSSYGLLFGAIGGLFSLLFKIKFKKSNHL